MRYQKFELLGNSRRTYIKRLRNLLDDTMIVAVNIFDHIIVGRRNAIDVAPIHICQDEAL
jgi:hypothetical protein